MMSSQYCCPVASLVCTCHVDLQHHTNINSPEKPHDTLFRINLCPLSFLDQKLTTRVSVIPDHLQTITAWPLLAKAAGAGDHFLPQKDYPVHAVRPEMVIVSTFQQLLHLYKNIKQLPKPEATKEQHTILFRLETIDKLTREAALVGSAETWFNLKYWLDVVQYSGHLASSETTPFLCEVETLKQVLGLMVRLKKETPRDQNTTKSEPQISVFLVALLRVSLSMQIM